MSRDLYEVVVHMPNCLIMRKKIIQNKEDIIKEILCTWPKLWKGASFFQRNCPFQFTHIQVFTDFIEVVILGEHKGKQRVTIDLCTTLDSLSLFKFIKHIN